MEKENKESRNKKMSENDKYVRFDWAAKRMLRDKANFGVFEGLMTVLIGEPMKIVEILESEGNQDSEMDKFNRVDIKARNSKDEIVLVEIQQTRELHYLQRILYGVAKTITEHISKGNKFDHVKKVYSISILYFDLGKGADYLYHGQTTFEGVHTHDTLQINTREKNAIRMKAPEEIFPEYYIIRVNEFNQVAKTPLEEWLDYLKSGHIKDNTTTPGLAEAKEKLQYLQMSATERAAYDRHIENVMIQNDILETKVLEGIEQGREEGFGKGFGKGFAEGQAKGQAIGQAMGRAMGLAEGQAEGEAKGRIEIARKMKEKGMQLKDIEELTGLSKSDIESLT